MSLRRKGDEEVLPGLDSNQDMILQGDLSYH